MPATVSPFLQLTCNAALCSVMRMTKSENLVVRVTPALKSRLQKKAEAERRVLSDYVTKVLEDAVTEKRRQA